MDSLIQRYWYLFAAASGTLLMLTFYPFYLWPLCFVALVPLFCVSISTKVSLRRVFISAAVATAMVVFLIASLIAIQFHWTPATHSFMVVAPFGGVLFGTTLYALLFGCGFTVFRLLRTDSFVLTSLLAATMYAVCERLAQILLGGYYLPSLAHAAVPLQPLASFASLGSDIFVTAVIVWINISVAEFIIRPEVQKATLQAVIALSGILVLLYFGNQIFLRSHQSEPRPFTVTTIQIGSWDEHVFGSINNNDLTFPAFNTLLQQMVATSPDLIVYPESLTLGLTDPSLVGKWIKKEVPRDLTIVTWDNIAKGEKIYTGYHFWENGVEIGTHYKQQLVPFMDYTPSWARSLGVSTDSFDISAASNQSPVSVNGITVGGLICSEAHRAALARTESLDSEVLLAAASDAMFQDDAVGGYTLASARYRATENNIPVIRASLIGLSSLINADGSLAAYAPMWKKGILTGILQVRRSHQTIYSTFGLLPITAFGILIFFLSILKRYKILESRFLGK